MPRPSRRPDRSVRAGTLRLSLVVFALLGVNIYFLGLRGGTSIGALIHTTRVRASAVASGTATTAPVAKKPTAPLLPLPEDPIGARLQEGVLADGQTVAQALLPLVGKKLAASLETALSAELDLASVRAGQAFALVVDPEDRAVAFEFRATNTLAHRIEIGSHKLTASKIEGRADVRLADLTLPAGLPLWDTLKRSGETAALADRLAEVFGGEGDVTGSGAASGERLRVVVEKRLIGGRFFRYGRVLGAEWVTRAGLRRAFYFAGARPGYYTERGEAVARRYLALPLRASRASAQARRSLRPLTDGRVAVDYVTPPGSVVTAIADGTITGLSRGPGGATVTLELGPNEQVIYSRVTRLSRAVSIGAVLDQGQSLGRVDAGLTLTYAASAAHFAVGQSNVPRLQALSAQERPRFGEQIAPVLARLRGLALRASDPLAARALSAIP